MLTAYDYSRGVMDSLKPTHGKTPSFKGLLMDKKIPLTLTLP